MLLPAALKTDKGNLSGTMHAWVKPQNPAQVPSMACTTVKTLWHQGLIPCRATATLRID